MALSVRLTTSRGSIGSGDRRSTATNAASATAATTAATALPPITAYTPAPRAGAAVAAPAGSSRPGARSPRGTSRQVAKAAATTIGTLSQNTGRQPPAVTTAPPSTGPAASASADTPAQTPRARARSARPGWALVMTASVPGSSSAAPNPWPARAATSSGAVAASPHAADATPNSPKPVRTTRRWPTTSPSAPPVSRNAARTTV